MYLRVVLRFSIKTKTVVNTLYFAIEDWWVLDIDSFVSGKTSKLYIQALEDSVILTIDRAKKEQLS
jgi:hypothetical protein